ncbi:MAG: phosphodiester glycosidase family protein [Maricaulaceae bacterium]
MKRVFLGLTALCAPLLFGGGCAAAGAKKSAESAAGCKPVTYASDAYTVCQFPSAADIRLFWGDVAGTPHGSFDAVNAALAGQGEALSFAMNAGMYHADRRPVGLYREQGVQTTGLQTRASSGNFGMLPNGVFYRDGDKIGVMETKAFASAKLSPDYASQSGPMLVIGGKLHPKFKTGSTSKKRRNGVGVSADGKTVYFAISEQPVNFHSFATLFKDYLKTPNALYFDGVVSRLYDPKNARHDGGLPMGPIVGVVDTITTK